MSNAPGTEELAGMRVAPDGCCVTCYQVFGDQDQAWLVAILFGWSGLSGLKIPRGLILRQ